MNKKISSSFEKSKEKYLTRSQFEPDFLVEKQFDFYVIIPLRREKELFPETLVSLQKSALRFGKDKIAYIIVINSDPDEETCEENIYIGDYCKAIEHLFVIDRFREKRLDKGVGEARKLGMDHALFWSKKNAWIVSLDADTCVDENYFEAIDAKGERVVLVDFKHRNPSPAVLAYEDWLRYFNAGLLRAGSPYAYVPLGSRFALRLRAYVESGGMVKRAAGEDFHFLQKLTKLTYPDAFGRAQTCVYPSGRESDRVPWGTGPAISDIHKGLKNYDTVEPAEAFLQVKTFIECFDSFYDDSPDLAEELTQFLEGEGFTAILGRLRENSKTRYQFSRQLHIWFDGLRTIRFVNYFTRIHGKEALREALGKLI